MSVVTSYLLGPGRYPVGNQEVPTQPYRGQRMLLCFTRPFLAPVTHSAVTISTKPRGDVNRHKWAEAGVGAVGRVHQ